MRPRKKPNLTPRLAACAPVVIQSPEEKKGRIREEFPNPGAPLHLELGCGKGAFICALAELHPDVNFVAMEKEANVAVIATERAMEARLPNLRFILDDADHLPEIFLPGEVGRIYINFCDPWHKHRQFKRRLTYRGRLAVYNALLADGGEVWFKTDNYMLYHFSTFEFDACMERYFSTTDLHRSEYAEGNIMTEYERYFSDLGQPIYSIRARRNPDCALVPDLSSAERKPADDE